MSVQRMWRVGIEGVCDLFRVATRTSMPMFDEGYQIHFRRAEIKRVGVSRTEEEIMNDLAKRTPFEFSIKTEVITTCDSVSCDATRLEAVCEQRHAILVLLCL